jgi:ornithine carbamoyltransferase
MYATRRLLSLRRAGAVTSVSARAFASSSSSPANALASLADGNFLSTAQLSSGEFHGLVDQAIAYKKLYSNPATKATAPKPLAGEICSMIFQKRSTRTRISSEVGMHLLGGKALFLSSDDIQLGVNESLKDTALVLSRFNSVILARVFAHADVQELAQLASVPVINALSDKYHPLQALADYMTLKEHFGTLSGLTLAWVGDGNNVLHDYMLAAPKVGAHIRIATPKGYEPDADVVAETQRLAKVSIVSYFSEAYSSGLSFLLCCVIHRNTAHRFS